MPGAASTAIPVVSVRVDIADVGAVGVGECGDDFGCAVRSDADQLVSALLSCVQQVVQSVVRNGVDRRVVTQVVCDLSKAA